MTYQIPLSPYAEILYTEWKIQPLRSDYNIVFDQMLEGHLDKIKLDRAVKRLLSEYLLLNSHIKENGENLFWVKNKEFYEIEYFDNILTNQKILTYVQEPFDLNAGPLYRFGLIKYKPNKYRFIIVLHHILIDGLTMDFFCQELSNYYNNENHHTALSLKKQEIGITNLSKDLAKNLALIKSESSNFWKKKLADAEPVNLHFLKTDEFNTSHKRLKKISEVRFNFGNIIFERLHYLKETYSITPYLCAQSIFALLLHKMSNQANFCFSYPIRIKEGEHFIYGAHINTNIISYNFNKISTFIDLIKYSKDHIHSIKGQIPHNYLPVTEILSGHNKQILNCCFAQTNLKDTPLTFKGIKATVCHELNIDLAMDLLFELEVKNKKINFRVKYQTEKFDAVLIKQFIDIYQKLFKEILVELTNKELSTRAKSLNDYQILSIMQRKQLMDWNKTKRAYPKNKTIHQLFEMQVHLTPDNIAVRYKDTALTYRQLNEKANQLARFLKKHYQIQPGSIIALLLERNENLLVSLFAILKTGCAYVPIDPDYPTARVHYILEDTKTPLLLINEINKEKVNDLAPKTNVLVIDSNEMKQKLEYYSKQNLKTFVTSQSLAYILYTSGTTGNPKGVMIEHGGIVNRINWMNRQYPLSTHDKVLQKTPYTFDVSVWELFWATWYGASVVFAKPEGHKDIDYLKDFINTEQISIIHFVPSMLSAFLERIQTALPSLRYIFCSGEALTLQQVKLCHKALPYVMINNLYGPTEASIDVSYYDCKPGINAVYIGKPIDNISCYILDEHLSPLPLGVAGELYIGGVGLARGYLNKEDLTKENFIKNPLQTKREKRYGHNAKLYKTGDLARWIPNGNIEYLGRTDLQVKVRGNRIELGEIETVLSYYPGIKQCVVLAKKRSSQKSRPFSDLFLVGYYSAKGLINEKKMYQYLQSRLPEYMIPSLFIKLNEFPLNANGKIDRLALNQFELSTKNESAYAVPKNPLEKLVRDYYAKILNLSRSSISAENDFFQLGGDSILAIRLINSLNFKLKLNLKVQDLYEHKTIRKLAQHISSKKLDATKEIPYMPFSLANRISHTTGLPNLHVLQDIYPASYLQTGMLIESNLNETGTYHDVFVYSIDAPYNEEQCSSIWHQLAQKHALLRASFFLTRNGFCVSVHKDNEIEMYSYQNLNTQQLISAERLNPFNYNKPGLFRILINQKEQYFELIFSFHHAIADGWSVASLVREFIEAYLYKKPILSNIKLNYAEFVQQELIAIADETAINFWKDYLYKANIAKAEWKKSDDCSDNSLFTLAVNLNHDQIERIHHISKKLGISTDTVFLGAYFKMLSYYLNSTDLTIGLVVNNRLEKAQGDEIFGLFLNTIPLRLNLSKCELNHDMLQSIFNNKTHLRKYQKAPYSYLKKCLKIEPYDFVFSFVHFHILNQYLEAPASFVEYERTSIPFTLNVFQHSTTGFCIKMSVHDDYIDKDFLSEIMRSYLSILNEILTIA